MSRTKFTSHSEDLKAIKQFVKTVSWGNECTLCTLLDGTAAYLLAPNLYILCPCPWEKYNELKPVIEARAQIHGVKPGVIITNEADEQNCERIWRDAMDNSVIVYWLSAKNSMKSTKLITQALEGINWNKTLANILKDGMEAKPVFEWESKQ